MKKNTLLIALGQKPGDEDEEEVSEDTDGSDEDDTTEDESIKTALDPDADIDTRIAAFRKAVELCVKGGY